MNESSPQPGTLAAESAPETPEPDAITHYARVLGLLALETASVALALWSLLHWSQLTQYLVGNEIDPGARLQLIGGMLGGAVLAGVAASAYALWPCRRGLARVDEIARRLAPLSVIGLVPMLFKLEAWIHRDLVFLTLVAVFGFGLRAAVLAALAAPPLSDRAWWPRASLAAYGPALIVLTGVVAYALYFAAITITNHHNLRTGCYDLGVENNLVWNIVNGGPWFKSSPLYDGRVTSHFGFHATFFSSVIGLVYRFAQRPETLLAIQATLIAAAAIPLYLLARRRLAAWPAALVALCYLLYAPVHGANLYDFHYQPLAPFFLWMTLWCVEAERRWLAAAFALLSLSLREDAGLLLGVLGLYLSATNRKPVAGLLLAALGLGYFIVMKLWVMPPFLPDGIQSYVHQYQGLLGQDEIGLVGIGKTIAGNPAFTLQTLLVHGKLVYLLQIMAPLAFIPLLRTSGWLCCLPGIALTLLSTDKAPLYQISFQYTAYWTSCLFIPLIDFLQQAGQPADVADPRGTLRQRAWLAALLASVLITSHQYGAVLQQQYVRGGFFQFTFGSTATEQLRYAMLQTLLAAIPPEAKVAAPDPLVSHISSRADAYALPPDYFDAEYILFTLVPLEPMGIHGAARAKITQALRDGGFGVLHRLGPFVLARRGHSTEENAAVLAEFQGAP